MGTAYQTDPIRRLIGSVEDMQASFVVLPDDEQAARGRYFLMTRAMSRNTAYAWSIALSESLDNIVAALAGIDDAAILDGLRRAEADFG